MPTEQMNEMPAEIKEMPEGAQNIFKAAFKSAQEDGMSQQGALDVAWNSVKRGYEKGADRCC
jgi:cation transport regulator